MRVHLLAVEGDGEDVLGQRHREGVRRVQRNRVAEASAAALPPRFLVEQREAAAGILQFGQRDGTAPVEDLGDGHAGTHQDLALDGHGVGSRRRPGRGAAARRHFAKLRARMLGIRRRDAGGRVHEYLSPVVGLVEIRVRKRWQLFRPDGRG